MEWNEMQSSDGVNGFAKCQLWSSAGISAVNTSKQNYFGNQILTVGNRVTCMKTLCAL
jgi:hypothetical protein